MAHHGWIPVLAPESLTPSGLKSPFGRLFPSAAHTYDSHAIALLAGALGPLHRLKPIGKKGTNPAGFTFLGQFIDHDMTEFRVIGEEFRLLLQNPTIGQRQRVVEDRQVDDLVPTTTNGRTGKLDLDAVYGLLGIAQPNLYTDNGLFLLQEGTDIIRGSQFREGRLIADPRNDENKILVQLHILFARLHNKIHAASSGTPAEKRPAGKVFAATKALVLAIYRQIVLHDYLPRIIRLEQLQAVVDALAAGEAFYQKMTARNRLALRNLGLSEQEAATATAMPVEFAHAVFRLGHTQLRAGYQLNDANDFPLFATGEGDKDLRGRETLTPEFIIEWSHFFAGGDNPPQHGEPIDGSLPEPIFRLPPPAVTEPPLSLAERNIRRGVDFGLPSGQEVASYLTEVYGPIKQTPFEGLFPPDLQQNYKEILTVDPTLAWRTPLWYYIIREAKYLEQGPHLGPVGGFIVAETILGSLVETEGFGLGRLIEEFATVEADPAQLPTAAPSNPAEIKTMAQLVQFVTT